MGKAERASVTKKNLGFRHDPLHVDITNEEGTKLYAKPVKNRAKFVAKANKGEKEDDEYIDPKISKKILKLAREQQEEFQESEDEDEYDRIAGKDEEIYEEEEEEEIEEVELDYYGDSMDIEELDQADVNAMNKFLPEAPGERINLADLIRAKLEQYDNAQARANETKDTSAPTPPGINPKVAEVYSKVGLLLSRYKSGKLPKAFKIIPSLSNWEDILYLTRPEKWTPHAFYEATRIFASNLKSRQSQRFFHYVLLDRVRMDIQESKKLSPHLYMAIKKALFKPASFFKGFLFPLCESGTCTLREAVIIGSVLTKVSVPMLHSAAALLRLAEMEYSGANSLFIRLLLDKKYALPYKVIDALVFHFVRMKDEEEALPVLWHQAFLVFAQRYKQDITPEQKDALFEVLRKQNHHTITPEIRRELVSSTSRGEIMQEDDMMMSD
ncbi:Bystin-domain-containing protein [Neoconidiobolus thromboides FSU 785]|nr:Bystin-domain-containing protein [Neoconidiobolus thromboides FSU 785]